MHNVLLLLGVLKCTVQNMYHDESWRVDVLFPRAGEEQNKEALQDVEDENQWNITANIRLQPTHPLPKAHS